MENDLIRRISVLELIENVKMNPEISINYGTLLDIMREIREIPAVCQADEADKMPCQSKAQNLDGFRELIHGQENVSDWIYCGDGKNLPKKSNSYFVTKHIAESENCAEKYETCPEIFWISDKKWDCERDPYCEWKVIAWQPLPKPYKP